MKVYVIRHRPTGHVMPSRVYTSGGWSHWDHLGPQHGHHDGSPRLFYSRESARNALVAWLRGRWTKVITTEGGWEEPTYDVENPPEPAHDHTRHVEDMEIVEGELSLPGVEC